MTAAAGPRAPSWFDANQRYLAAAVTRVRSLLELHRSRGGGSAPVSAATETEAPAQVSEPGCQQPLSALDRVCRLFGLSPFEREVLLLCAGVELDAEFAALVGALQGDPGRIQPTFSLALAALPGPHWSALSSGAALRRWRLIDITPGTAITASPLRIDERILHFLTGVAAPEERLSGVVEPVQPARDLAPSHRELAARIAAVWSRPALQALPPVIQLCGEAEAEKYAVAATACAAVGVRLSAAAMEAIPAAAGEAEALTRLWEREAVLSESALLIDCGEHDSGDATRQAALVRFVERVRGLVLLAGRERRRFERRPTITFEVNKATRDEQRAAWHRILGEAAARLDGQVDQLVSQFHLGQSAMHAAAAEALGSGQAEGSDLGRILWGACRGQARPKLDDLAQRIEPVAGWSDLVLPEAQHHVLREIAGQVRQRTTVYEKWGFARHGERGLGISALFAGASGTGKTLAAEVLANELRLDLYRIDLSSVVSKYIGETEKNLRRVFDAAEEGGAILLFDEADALFGRRSEVKDSHDRYANIEVSYLLQRMECYRELAILTTNLKSALDPAFLRRIRFVVQFPFPDSAQRTEIWRRIFPAETPTVDLVPERLAQLGVPGGNIRNIALNAAFLAADAGEPVRMEHVLRAARTEYAKLEKQLTEAEIGGWE